MGPDSAKVRIAPSNLVDVLTTSLRLSTPALWRNYGRSTEAIVFTVFFSGACCKYGLTVWYEMWCHFMLQDGIFGAMMQVWQTLNYCRVWIEGVVLYVVMTRSTLPTMALWHWLSIAKVIHFLLGSHICDTDVLQDKQFERDDGEENKSSNGSR